MSRPKPRKSLVLVKGTDRVVINYDAETITIVVHGDLTIKRFCDLRYLTPALYEKQYRAWGYTQEQRGYKRGSGLKNLVCAIEGCMEPCCEVKSRGKTWRARYCTKHRREDMARAQAAYAKRKKEAA